MGHLSTLFKNLHMLVQVEQIENNLKLKSTESTFLLLLLLLLLCNNQKSFNSHVTGDVVSDLSADNIFCQVKKFWRNDFCL